MSILGGFLPTYAKVGVWSYVLFCSLRLMMGISSAANMPSGTPSPSNMLRKNGAARLAVSFNRDSPSATCGSLVFALVSYLTTRKPCSRMAGESFS